MRINSKIINMKIVLLAGLVVFIFLSLSINSVIATNYPVKVKENMTMRWDFEYTGNYDVDFSTIEWIKGEVISLNSNSIAINFTDSLGSIQLSNCYPIETLSYLPIGSNSSYVAEPTLVDIISPLSFISPNWKAQFDYWLDEEKVVTINNRLAIHHLKYPFEGKLRDVFIFNGTVTQTHFGNDCVGIFNVVYTGDSGLLLELFVDINIGYVTQNIAFNLTLNESSINIPLSFYVKDIILVVGTFGIQIVVLLALFSGVIIKQRMDKRLLEHEEQDKAKAVLIEEEEEEKPIIILDVQPPEDYNFTYNCPFCNAEMTQDDEVCPQCGGKR